MAKAFDLTQWARPEVLALTPYTSARDTFTTTDGNYNFLDANENPNPSSVNRYPDPNQLVLKKKIAALRNCSVDQLLIGNGSDEILDLIFRAFCSPNKDNVIIMPPTYGMYAVLANINGVGIKEVPLTADFQLNTEKILSTVSPNTKAIFFCSPNNPSGNLFKRSDIKQLLNNFDGVVIIDEAYIDFTDGPSWLTQLDSYPNLMITQTLSKAFGLAGLRLGIAIGHPSIIELLHNIKPPYNINTLSQQKAIESLTDIEKVDKQIKELLTGIYQNKNGEIDTFVRITDDVIDLKKLIDEIFFIKMPSHSQIPQSPKVGLEWIDFVSELSNIVAHPREGMKPTNSQISQFESIESNIGQVIDRMKDFSDQYLSEEESD